MTIFCSVMNHVASAKRHHNQGLEFSICHRCGCDLIRIEDSGEWSAVPEGFRVVWRETASTDRRPASPPRRRAPRNARPAARRDARGRPLASAATMFSAIANLRKLVGTHDDPERMLFKQRGQQVIRLPGPAC